MLSSTKSLQYVACRVKTYNSHIVGLYWFELRYLRALNVNLIREKITTNVYPYNQRLRNHFSINVPDEGC